MVLVNLIKDIIRSRDDDDRKQLEDKLYQIVVKQAAPLIDIIFDRQELINVRAMAARLLFAKADSTVPNSKQLQQMEQIKSHRSSLVRLGVVFGLADKKDAVQLQRFLTDEHHVVREEAKNLLEELADEQYL